MNREIKFRAWDDSISKMLQWNELLRIDNDGRSYYGLISIFNRESYHYHLLQFTGLKDKNGEDIYEGDILDFTEDGKNRFSVEFHDASFYKIWLNDPSMSLLEYIGDSIIIGNIYENPELIAAKDGGVK